jgi:hypothetical protein
MGPTTQTDANVGGQCAPSLRRGLILWHRLCRAVVAVYPAAVNSSVDSGRRLKTLGPTAGLAFRILNRLLNHGFRAENPNRFVRIALDSMIAVQPA